MMHHKLDTDTQVFFYEQEFYVLSNFSAFSIWWNHCTFPTSEHAYQWAKFDYADVESRAQRIWTKGKILYAPSAHEALKIAEEMASLVNPDWKALRVETMRSILRAKVEQHEYVKRKLLETGDRILIEDSWRDDYWGWGPEKTGGNMLGRLWVEIRSELQQVKP